MTLSLPQAGRVPDEALAAPGIAGSAPRACVWMTAWAG